jgi:hypothetical protein
MRRYLVLPVVGVCLLLWLLTSGATAVAGGGSTYYAGKNSQGRKLLFTVDHTSSGAKFDPLFLNQVLRCPLSGDVIRVEFTFQGVRIPIRNGKFSLFQNDLTDLVRWSGTIASKKASGKESIDLAAFDNKGHLQDCGAGSLSWKANGLIPASAATAAPGASFVVKVTKGANGKLHFSITH